MLYLYGRQWILMVFIMVLFSGFNGLLWFCVDG